MRFRQILKSSRSIASKRHIVAALRMSCLRSLVFSIIVPWVERTGVVILSAVLALL